VSKKFEDIKVGQRFIYTRDGRIFRATKLGTDSWQSDGQDPAKNWYEHKRAIIEITPLEGEKKSMLKSVFEDVRGYISDNREIVYTIAFVLIVDQLVFDGAFRERIKAIIDGLLKKAENKVGTIEGVVVK